jgi:uncharacterized protein YqhQ
VRGNTKPESWPRERLAPVMGGQAVIEGVMMRSPWRVALAVRKPDGAVVVEGSPFISLTRRVWLLGKPIFRGAVSLVEIIVLGIKTLQRSAELSLDDGEAKGSSKFAFAITAAIAFAAGIGLFVLLPLSVSDWLGVRGDPLLFNLLAGGVRVTLVVAYLYAISRMSDVQRLFRYHGAEHQSIAAFEAGDLDSPVEAAKYPTRHARCGTSFIVTVVLLGVFLFALSDALYAGVFGAAPSLLVRWGYHLLLLPLLGGIGYEALKLSAKHRDRGLSRLAVVPGLWLQSITTGQPDDEMREVALAAMRESLDGWEHLSETVRVEEEVSA